MAAFARSSPAVISVCWPTEVAVGAEATAITGGCGGGAGGGGGEGTGAG